jgi:hypothetical protein
MYEIKDEFDTYKPHTVVHIMYEIKDEFSLVGVLLILDFKQSELKHMNAYNCTVIL